MFLHLIILIIGVNLTIAGDEFLFGKFPSGFQWGVAGSKYSTGHSEGDRLKDDVESLKELGVSTYTFSLDWSALFPDANSNSKHRPSSVFYKYMIAGLISNNIQPHIILYDHNTIGRIQALGGWRNDISSSACTSALEIIAPFGSLNLTWSTFSDPISIITETYATGSDDFYQAVHTILLTHSCIYHGFKRNNYTGNVGISLKGNWYEPELTSDVTIVDTAFQFDLGLFAEPIMKSGDYPDVVRNATGSRLPEFKLAEITMLKGSADFVSIIYGDTYKTTIDNNTNSDGGFLLSRNSTFTPHGLRLFLNKLSTDYPDIDIYVTNVGVATNDDDVRDRERVEIIRQYADETLKSILLDNNTLVNGFSAGPLSTRNQGLYQTDPVTQSRMNKSSAVLYRQLIKDNGFERGYNGPGGFPSGQIYHEDGIYYDQFPDDFAWSSATSAYQIEGGWNEDGKGLSIWDTYANSPGHVANDDNGKIACDSYHKYMDDIKLLKNLGTKYYRFSIAWTRLMPDGTKRNINEKGIAYYNELINELIDAGMEPMVTLYHWDLPQTLSDYGGWLNESTTDHFQDYAQLCYDMFGDRVKFWITFNEPWIVAYLGYGVASFPPSHYSPGEDVYTAAHNLIKAHAKAYRVYDTDFKIQQKAKIGITLNVGWSEPYDMYNPSDLEASDRDINFNLGWFAHPIYVNGDYPEVMKTNIADKSKTQGYNKSRLPEFTAQEKIYIKGTHDFLGLNFYTSGVITSDIKTDEHGSYDDDKDIRGAGTQDWIGSGSSWLRVTPFGIRKILNWLKKEYNNEPVYVTENGVSDRNGTLRDYHRIHYYRTYINEMLKAIKLDDCNVKGYTAWSLMDNFEWGVGYAEKFGIHYVNFSDPDRTRVPKGSAYWYKQMVSDNGYKPGYPAIGGRGTAPDYVGKFYNDTFSEGFFEWGVGTSAFQVEGAWNTDGKGPSIMDTAAHSNNDYRGDVASDSYHNYKADVQLLRDLKVNFYRFSISWSRLFPTGAAPVNMKGVEYYNNLIDELLKWNIKPFVTLYSNDLPQALAGNNNGWLNPDTVDYFVDYADECFRRFGNKVGMWITFDNPIPEGSMSRNDAIAIHNMMMAHARVYNLYKTTYMHGKIGLALRGDWMEPKDEFNPSDWEAAEIAMQMTLGCVANPIFSGNYSDMSIAEDTMIPTFNDSEIASLSGSADFFGVNVFTSMSCTKKSFDPAVDGFWPTTDTLCTQDNSDSGMNAAPWGIRKTLNWISSSYGNNIPIYVTASSVYESTNKVENTDAVNVYKDYIDEVLKANKLDYVNVVGYTAWCLLDCYNPKMETPAWSGLYHVDFNNPARPRTPKASAVFYRNVVVKNGFKEVDLDTYIPQEHGFLKGKFPDDFLWATATASFQTEGATNEGGRGPSIWDTFTREPGRILNNDTADISSDGYHHYLEDVKLLKALQVKMYRFSISWSRIYPTGTGTTPNPEGVAYYNNLIDALVAEGIKPIVTLYHWDFPQGLMDYGGWENATTADVFADYADTCFRLFGDRVKFWLTENEPWVMSLLGYEIGQHAPGIKSNGTLVYITAHNLILAHAKAYRIYDSKYRSHQHGKVGITFNCDWWIPKNPADPADWNAADRALEFHLGLFANPIYVNGDYPEVVKEYVGRKSTEGGLAKSRLPEFTDEEKMMIRGSADFMGLNAYTSSLAAHHVCDYGVPGYFCDMEVEQSKDPAWPGSGAVWLKVNPPGMRRILNYIKDKYNNVPVYITENGISDNNGTLRDQHRISYYNSYINEMLKAITIDGCNVKGYAAWALLDDFEWNIGYNEKFGFYNVDFNDPGRKRTPKDSAIWYRHLIQNNGFTDKVGIPYENEFLYGQFPDNFVWSAASAAYQIEGGWDADGKGESIWDHVMHQPIHSVDGMTGDIADDSYHKFPEDINLLRALKVNHYRFSIAWTRILPDGVGTVNQAGIDYYNRVINMLLEANIVPMVTLYHWDLPQKIQEHGGWLNRTTAELFEHYTDVCFQHFGDRVKMWITLNEPWIIAYVLNRISGINATGAQNYEVGHALILAHARAYRLYEMKYKPLQKGNVGITLNVEWATPKDPSNPLDIEACERHLQFHLGWFAHPIYVNGDYPATMRLQVNKKNKEGNIPGPRLPVFTEKEKEMIKGSYDFFGLNHYTTARVWDQMSQADGSYYGDQDIEQDQDPSWEGSGSSWLFVTPFGMRRIVNWIKREYGDVPIYITENGLSDNTGTLEDHRRVNYYKHYINELMKAVSLDDVNVKGYTVWSLMDNLEWNQGYTERFGLHYVNISDPERPRTPKLSAAYYREVIMRNGFPKEPVKVPDIRFENEFLYGEFPEGFAWSVATASYQVEGGWDADGKGVSIWDTFSHQGKILNHDTGDIACDTYHKFREDIILLKNLKVTHYRFSIAWTRILPDGTTKYINPAGIAYYNELINALLDAEIVPMVTMNHWDLPQALEDVGGWTNSSSVDWFVDYANVLFENYGDRVKYWITHNEPWVLCHHGYETGEFAPGRVNSGYPCGHNLILSHGQVYRLYYQRYKDLQKGMVGITLSHTNGEPKNKTLLQDIAAAETFNQFSLGWFANPIFDNGDYPDVMKWQVGNKSLEQGSKTSRLPAFTEEEKAMLKGSGDFLGYNMYTSNYVKATVNPLFPANWDTDMDVITTQDPSWGSSGSSWLKVTPWGIRAGLNWIRTHYNNVPVYVTENGVSDNTGDINDQWRIDYYKAYINEVLKAIRIDDCDIRGYTAWSFMDNFEWMRGYSERFGLHYVNFSDPERPRTPKASAGFYTSIIEVNGFVKGGNDVSPTTQSNPVTDPNKPNVITFHNDGQASSSNGFNCSYLTVIIGFVIQCVHVMYMCT